MRMNRKARMRALEARCDADDARTLNAHLEECASIAVMLKDEIETRKQETIRFGGKPGEAARKEQQKQAAFARLFASWGLAYLACPAGVCLRARRCAHARLVCTEGHTLSGEERAQAKARFRDFIHFMRAPETEEEQALGRRA
jgi:hypothetical protein